MSSQGLTISAGVDAAIRQHGQETYPHECCGALVGGGGLVTAIVALPNTTDEGPRRDTTLEKMAGLKPVMDGGTIESVTVQGTTDVLVVFKLTERPRHRCDQDHDWHGHALRRQHLHRRHLGHRRPAHRQRLHRDSFRKTACASDACQKHHTCLLRLSAPFGAITNQWRRVGVDGEDRGMPEPPAHPSGGGRALRSRSCSSWSPGR